jgi:hypothetical protein
LVGLGSHKNFYRRLLRRELKRVFCEAFHDREKAEIVALNSYPLLNIEKGEVLKNPTYLHPSLARLQVYLI